MKVIVAKTAGFCKGVKDALEITLEAIQGRAEGERICTYGPLIHNRQVLAMLEEKGIREESSIGDCGGRKVVIRAHGIPPDERRELHNVGAKILDATCKRVAKVHAAIKLHARRGFHTVIVGDADHAEVIGLMGYTQGRGVVINSPEQVITLPGEWQNVILVAQTTQNEEVFKAVRECFIKRFPSGVVKNTICDSTHERQAEVRELCSRVEAMVIVGGAHSGNTVRLAEVARDCGVPTYHVETEEDLDPDEIARYSCVGVSAGASTPNWIIRNVSQFLRRVQPERTRISFKMRKFLESVARANLFVALGAALLPFAVHGLTGQNGSMLDSAIAACYVFAIHTLNIYLDRGAIQLNDPGRAAFYQKWRVLFTCSSLAAMTVSLALTLLLGPLTFFAMTLCIIVGVIYAVPLILPAAWQKLQPWKIKDIPTSKTFSVPIAWASVIAIIPGLNHFPSNVIPLAYAFWVTFLLVLVRTCLLDILAVQGDRLVGKETLVVLIGERKTAQFTMGVLALLTVSLTAGYMSGVADSFALVILPAIGIYMLYLKASFKRRLREDPMFEFFIESVIILIGIAGVLW